MWLMFLIIVIAEIPKWNKVLCMLPVSYFLLEGSYMCFRHSQNWDIIVLFLPLSKWEILFIFP